jgi:hypothetical protein
VQKGKQKGIKEAATPANLRKASVYLSTIESWRTVVPGERTPLSGSVLIEAPNTCVAFLLAAKGAVKFVCALLERLKHNLHDVAL